MHIWQYKRPRPTNKTKNILKKNAFIEKAQGKNIFSLSNYGLTVSAFIVPVHIMIELYLGHLSHH